MKRARVCMGIGVAAMLWGFALSGSAEEAPPIEPRATELVKAMAKTLAGLPRARAETEFSLQLVLESGQKLEYGGESTAWFQRPNRLRSERDGERGSTTFLYDGKHVVMHAMPQNLYAKKAAPDNIDAFLDFMDSQLDVAPPGVDLLYSDGGLGLLDDVTSGIVVGVASIAGRRCHHVAFRAPDVDWQLWIEEGDRPLPCRIVIETLDVERAPEMSITYRVWDTEPELSDSLFVFTPPEGAAQIVFGDPDAAPPAGENQ
ncbi:MAG: DUF2092 domain-containing protein [Myxococcota bacterium]